jgi:hypothetical protein
LQPLFLIVVVVVATPTIVIVFLLADVVFQNGSGCGGGLLVLS